MKRTRILGIALATCALALPLFAGAQNVIGPTTFTFSSAATSYTWTCNTGQSSFALSIPSGMTATFTVTVSQSSSGTAVNPPWSYAPGSASYANTITNSGALTVNLGSNQYVTVTASGSLSGSTMASGVCSSAVAVIPPQAGGGGGSPLPDFLASPPITVTSSPAAGATPASVQYGCASCVTGILAGAGGVTVTPTSSPGGNAYIIAIPTPTPYVCSGCVTGVVAGNNTTVTPTASPGGNAVVVSAITPSPAPSPMATATACAAPVSVSGYTINVPICPTPPPLYTSGMLGLGAWSGTVATADTVTQPVPHWDNAYITGLSAACQTYDSTTVLTFYQDGTSIATLTLDGGPTDTTFSTPSAVPSPSASPHVYTASITTAGTAAGCAFAARFYQQAATTPIP